VAFKVDWLVLAVCILLRQGSDVFFLPGLQLANPPTIWKKGAEGYKVKLSKKYTSNCRKCNELPERTVFIISIKEEV
jgi:hypothetical protein